MKPLLGSGRDTQPMKAWSLTACGHRIPKRWHSHSESESTSILYMRELCVCGWRGFSTHTLLLPTLFFYHQVYGLSVSPGNTVQQPVDLIRMHTGLFIACYQGVLLRSSSLHGRLAPSIRTDRADSAGFLSPRCST